MNVYVETNFVLELVREQEHYVSCEALVAASQAHQITLVVPAFSLAESHWTLTKDKENRKDLQVRLTKEISQFIRTEANRQRLANIEEIGTLLVDSDREAEQRFLLVREQLLAVAEVLPLSAETFGLAPQIERRLGLKLLDSLQYAAILSHLQAHVGEKSCFLNRDGGFDNPNIKAELRGYNCRLISTFTAGWEYVSHTLQ